MPETVPSESLDAFVGRGSAPRTRTDACPDIEVLRLPQAPLDLALERRLAEPEAP